MGARATKEDSTRSGWLADWLISLNKRVVNPSIWHKHTHTHHRKVCAYCMAPTLLNEWGGTKPNIMLTVHYGMTCVINTYVCACERALFIKWLRYFASHQHLKLYDFSEHRFKNGIFQSKKEIGSPFITVCILYFILFYLVCMCAFSIEIWFGSTFIFSLWEC